MSGTDFGGNLSAGLWAAGDTAPPARGPRDDGAADGPASRSPDRDASDRAEGFGRRTDRAAGGQRDRRGFDWADAPRDSRSERVDAPRVPETGSRRRAEDIGETWPDLPDWATPDALDADARRDLRGLSKEGAAWVAAHLVAAGTLADDDPETAWWHARAARARGGRIAVVRETVGLVAYRAGEWAEAIGELRAARRMGGGPGHLAVLADCERALGHPEKAIELARSEQAADLDDEAMIELATVVAGARADLGQIDAGLAHLEQFGPQQLGRHPRLAYAYADLLDRAGREADALTWFIRAANADVDEDTDADERVEALAASVGAAPAASAAGEAEAGVAGSDQPRTTAAADAAADPPEPVVESDPGDSAVTDSPVLQEATEDIPCDADSDSTADNDVADDMTAIQFSDDPLAGER